MTCEIDKEVRKRTRWEQSEEKTKTWEVKRLRSGSSATTAVTSRLPHSDDVLELLLLLQIKTLGARLMA